jgi:5'-nucleotidase (lipoprotein e(P4) family)
MKIQKNIFIPILIVLALLCNKGTEKKIKTSYNEYLTQSVLWYQHSGEMKALYYQGYNFAKLRLDSYLSTNKSKRKMAVIVDIDETVLNNISYEVHMILSDSTNTKSFWQRWVDSAVADTLPGALEFLKYSQSKGIEVFYLSNRSVSDVAASIRNLKKFNFPFSDEQHMIFKSDKSKSKESRRKQIAQDYDIILLCGDNLGDFSAAFDNRTTASLTDSIVRYRNDFGSKFILFPNPMYGYWEKQIYGEGTYSSEQKDSIRKLRLRNIF